MSNAATRQVTSYAAEWQVENSKEVRKFTGKQTHRNVNANADKDDNAPTIAVLRDLREVLLGSV